MASFDCDVAIIVIDGRRPRHSTSPRCNRSRQHSNPSPTRFDLSRSVVHSSHGDADFRRRRVEPDGDENRAALRGSHERMALTPSAKRSVGWRCQSPTFKRR
jgi:hypothetical protein